MLSKVIIIIKKKIIMEIVFDSLYFSSKSMCYEESVNIKK